MLILVLLLLLLLIPLGICYATSLRMARLRTQLLHADDDLRELRSSYQRVRGELIDTRRRHRQYEVRRTFLMADIHQAQQRLAGLRAESTPRRMAA